MKHFTWTTLAFLSACLTVETAETDDKDNDGTTSDEQSDGESNTDTQTENNDACSDYRSTYPAGEYGLSVGSVLADFPGMVDGNGNPQNLADIYSDKSKQVLVIANAFDT